MVTYQDGKEAKVGDTVRSICGDYKGRVVELIEPKGVWKWGRVLLNTGHTLAANAVYEI